MLYKETCIAFLFLTYSCFTLLHQQKVIEFDYIFARLSNNNLSNICVKKLDFSKIVKKNNLEAFKSAVILP